MEERVRVLTAPGGQLSWVQWLRESGGAKMEFLRALFRRKPADVHQVGPQREEPGAEVAEETLEAEPVNMELSPRRLSDFIGQDKVKERLAISIAAAKARGEALDHILLVGPSGWGKGTLANIIAHEMGVSITITSGLAVDRLRDFTAIVSRLAERAVLFIDEVHRLPRPVQEMLCTAMEDRCLDIIMGKGLKAHTLRLRLKPFTVIGATTEVSNISQPLRRRFGVIYRLEPYRQQDIERLIIYHAQLLDIDIDEGAAQEISLGAEGDPVIARRLIRRVRDYAQVYDEGLITKDVALEGLGILKPDMYGIPPAESIRKGTSFEQEVLTYLQTMGFEAERTEKTADGGVDIIAHSTKPLFQGKYIIQCKNWSKPVGEPVVRDLYGVVTAERANKGILVTTSRFTASAMKFAKDKPLELIDGKAWHKLTKEEPPS